MNLSMSRKLLLGGLALVALCGHSAQAAKWNVFIMAGQSNMFGADAVIDEATPTRDLVEAGLQTEADRQALYVSDTPTLSSNWGDIRGHITNHLGPIVDAKTGKNFMGHGPEVGFNRALYASGLRKIAILQFTANYHKLEDGHSAWVSPNSLWQAWTKSIDTQLAKLTAQGDTYEIRGILWNEGIDDAGLKRAPADYQADVKKIVEDLRSRYGKPNTPFIIAREPSSPFPAAENMAAIQQAEVDLATEIENAAWIDCRDLTPYVNSHHLSSKSQLIQGERMAQAILPKLSGGVLPSPTPQK